MVFKRLDVFRYGLWLCGHRTAATATPPVTQSSVHTAIHRTAHTVIHRTAHTAIHRTAHTVIHRTLPTLPYTGLPTLPYTGQPTLSYTGLPTLPYTGLPTLSYTGLPTLPYTGLSSVTSSLTHRETNASECLQDRAQHLWSLEFSNENPVSQTIASLVLAATFGKCHFVPKYKQTFRLDIDWRQQLMHFWMRARHVQD